MNIRRAVPADREVLLDIWLRSVRATHTFLSEDDIQSFLPLVRDVALVELEVWVLCSASGPPMGFMGMSGNKLEVLFLAPEFQGCGGGRRLVRHAQELMGELTLDVNEQNPAARRFYEKCGFVVEGRSELDSTGRPFPLLHMRLAAPSHTAFDLGTTLPTLAAGRVRLRWLTDADVPSLFTIFGDPEVTRYWGFPVLPHVQAAATLLAEIHDHFRRRTLFQWGVELVESSELIGTCTLASLDPVNGRAEIGFALGRAWWGGGYMAEALPVLLGFAFRELRLHRLTADVDPRNGPSIRALERIGFQREGLLREHYLVQGEPQDGIVYGLLRSESQWA